MKKIEIVDELHQRSVKFTSSLPQKDLMSLLQYEMHGIQQLPAHVSKNEKNKNKEANENSFNGKEAKNSSDYRKSLFVVCLFFLEKIT